jgi:hypothetical protein
LRLPKAERSWHDAVIGLRVWSTETPESQFAGNWQTKISPVTEKHWVSLNISVIEGIAGGTVVLVNPDGTEITSPILDPALNGETLTFKTTFENGTTFSWHLSLKKDGVEGILHGSAGKIVTEEPVFKQH